MKVRRYTSPAAFKAALDQRLRNVAEPAIGITRRRQLLVFDRYLARLVQVFGSAATLKGGLVLELRLARARTTRDIDLRVAGSPDGLLLRLQEAGRLDLCQTTGRSDPLTTLKLTPLQPGQLDFSALPSRPVLRFCFSR